MEASDLLSLSFRCIPHCTHDRKEYVEHIEEQDDEEDYGDEDFDVCCSARVSLNKFSIPHSNSTMPLTKLSMSVAPQNYKHPMIEL